MESRRTQEVQAFAGVEIVGGCYEKLVGSVLRKCGKVKQENFLPDFYLFFTRKKFRDFINKDIHRLFCAMSVDKR